MGKDSQSSLVREFSAGGVVFKRHDGQVLWLVTKVGLSSRIPNPDTWRLPKGWLDDAGKGIPGPLARGKVKAKKEDLQNAALKEVREEGGVDAKILDKIGTTRFIFTWEGKKILKFVTFYLMEWTRDLPEGTDYETSEVAWLSFETARKRLTHSTEKGVLDKAGKLLELGIQESLV